MTIVSSTWLSSDETSVWLPKVKPSRYYKAVKDHMPLNDGAVEYGIQPIVTTGIAYSSDIIL